MAWTAMVSYAGQPTGWLQLTSGQGPGNPSSSPQSVSYNVAQNPGNSTLQATVSIVRTSTQVPYAQYTVTLVGNSPSVGIAISPSVIQIGQGQTTGQMYNNATISIPSVVMTPANGYTGLVNLSGSGLPSGYSTSLPQSPNVTNSPYAFSVTTPSNASGNPTLTVAASNTSSSPLSNANLSVVALQPPSIGTVVPANDCSPTCYYSPSGNGSLWEWNVTDLSGIYDSSGAPNVDYVFAYFERDTGVDESNTTGPITTTNACFVYYNVVEGLITLNRDDFTFDLQPSLPLGSSGGRSLTRNARWIQHNRP